MCSRVGEIVVYEALCSCPVVDALDFRLVLGESMCVCSF